MAEDTPSLVDYDNYINRLFAPDDETLNGALAAMDAAGLPSIQVSPNQGKLLYLVTLIHGAKRVLEIGTLGGYSTIWLARALPADGVLISLELEAHHADVARSNVARAGLSDRVEIRTGSAAESLRAMIAAGESEFDIVFIDADKPSYVEYLELSLQLVRPGGLILADNALSHNAITESPESPMHCYNAAVAAHPELESVIVPALKNGVDGLVISRRRI